MNILMAAAENNALRYAKAGGLADVIGEIGPALAKQSCRLTTVIPSYGFIHLENPAEYIGSVDFHFRGLSQKADIHRVNARIPEDPVLHLVFDHPLFAAPAAGKYRIYMNDPSDRPFATDADRFSLFCTALAAAIVKGRIECPDCIHLHDWHCAFFLILRRFHTDFSSLKTIRTVFTIHNLALQGTRPMAGDESSLNAWWPEMVYNPMEISDPTWTNCVNPMAAGIRFAEAVHTVSPSYAEELLAPCRKPDVFSGGECLETDLRLAKHNNRLFGILNGCPYPGSRRPPKLDFHDMIGVFKSAVLNWTEGKQTTATSHFLAFARLSECMRTERPFILATSVSRLTDQKMLLMKSRGSTGNTGFLEILRLLESHNGLYILLGTGDPEYERFFSDMSARFERFIFLNGFSGTCADLLYANGDLFLMPSSFEPCGISQMLAMRDGQPCLVHHVGGLKDTIEPGIDGFAFTGATLCEQVDHFVIAIRDALMMKKDAPDRWDHLCSRAAEKRFSWDETASMYIENLYRAG
ncbi:MAG: glycogen/starch synthase [Desulfobacterales bacterium]